MRNLFNLLDTSTPTTSGTGETPGSWASILIMIVYIIGFAALIYFILIRPQRKKTKEEQKMRDSVQVGDEIITIGGLYGRIVSKKDDDSFIMESGADKNKIRIAKWSIQTNLTLHDE